MIFAIRLNKLFLLFSKFMCGRFINGLFQELLGYRLPLVTKSHDLDQLPSVTNFLTEALVPSNEIRDFCKSKVIKLRNFITKKSKFCW